MEPRENKTTPIASTLQDAHEKLSTMINHSLADYAKAMVWNEKGEIIPVKESDPPPVQLSKHCLLALQEAERAAKGMGEVVERYQQGGVAGVVLGEVSGIAPFIAPEEKMGVLHRKRKTQGIDVYYAAQQLSAHAKAIARIAAEAKLPHETAAQLTSAAQSLTTLSPQAFLSGQFPNLSEALSNVMTTYFSTNRPAAPAKPEQKYDPRKADLALPWNPSAQERSEWLVLVEPVRSAMSGTKKLHELVDYFIQDAKERKIELDVAQVDLIKRTYDALEKSAISEGYYHYLDNGQETPLSQSLKGIFNVIWAINQLSKGYWENPGMAAHLQLIKHAKTALDHYWKIQWTDLGKNFGAAGDQLINAMLVYGKDMVFEKLEELAQSTHDIEFQQHLRFGVLLESTRPLFDSLESIYHERGLGVLTNPFGYSEKTREALEDKLRTAIQEEEKVKEEFDMLDIIMEKFEWYKKFAEDVIQPYPSGNRHGTLPLVEMVEETAQNLLLDLLQLKQTRQFNEDELAAIDRLENRLLSDLTLANKRILLTEKLRKQQQDVHFENLRKKIHKAIGQNKKYLAEEEKKGYWQRGREAVSSLVTPHPQSPWPQEELDLLIKAIDGLKKSSQQKLFNVIKYTEALAQHKKMRQEFALRSLKNAGLIALIEAARQDPKDNKINLAQKRKLALILADIRGESRSEYLTEESVPKIAAEFATDPEQIRTFIQQVHKIDPSLGHALAIEATLAHYISDIPNAILQSNDPIALNQDLINALTRLEAKQALAMLPKNPKDNIAHELTIFIALLESKPITNENLSSIQKDITELPAGLTRENFIKILTDCYKNHEKLLKQKAVNSGNPPQLHREIMNKIGLFLGRLAHTDTDMAKAIFNDPEALGILKQECLLKESSSQATPDRALYFESLVNTFSFNYPDGKHQHENRTFNAFLAENKNVVVKIHKALNQNTSLKDEEILSIYTKRNGQEELMKLLETFTKTCLSSGSDAEERLREFFSAMLLCQDTALVRDIILNLQKDNFGSRYTQYLELLTVEASDPFWKQVKKDLIEKPQRELLQQLDSAVQAIQLQITHSQMSDEEKKEMREEVEKFIAAKKIEAHQAVSHLTTGEKDMPIKCHEAVQKITRLKESIATQPEQWTEKIRKQANFKKLDNQLADIDTILANYLSKRGEKSAILNAFFNYDLRAEKRKLVIKYKNRFNKLRKEAKNVAKNIDDLAREAKIIGSELETEHEALLRLCE